MKKTFYIVDALLILAVLIGDACYMAFGGLLLKSLTSALFVTLGAINLVYAFKTKTKERMFAIFMLVGLTFSMVGDIVLNIEFMIGAAIFGVGHIFYFVAYTFAQRYKFVDFAICGLLALTSTLVVTFVKSFDFGSNMMEAVVVIYAFVISTMLGKATANLIRERNLKNILLVVGSGLFFFSDLMLLFSTFLPACPRVIGILCLVTYYPAQCLLASALLFTKTKEDAKSEVAETTEVVETETEAIATEDEKVEDKVEVNEEKLEEAKVETETKPKTSTRKTATKKTTAGKKTTSTKTAK